MSESPTPEQPPPARRHWIPRGALVFLALAAALVLVFVLIRPDWLTGDSDQAPARLRFDKTLADIGAVDGIRLSDDNATSQTVAFSLPIDARVEHPYLSLVGTTTVSDDSTIFLRVLADGQSVFVRQLSSGEDDLDEEIELPPSATEDGSVRIQVRTTGSLDQRRCNLTQELGALVVLDPGKTRIHGTLADPIRTVRDAVAILDDQVTLDLAFEHGSTGWYETAARYAVALTHAGYDVSYRDVSDADELTDVAGSQVLLGEPDDLAALGWDAADRDGATDAGIQVGEVDDAPRLAITRPSQVSPTFLSTVAVTTADDSANQPESADPQRLSGATVTLDDLGVDTSVQSLTDSRTWRASYSLADLPGGTVPTELRLRVSVPVTTDESRWLVQAQLNGQLVDSARLPGDVASQQLRLAIPSGLERVRNQLTITILRDRDLGGCNVRQTTYQVQVQPSSHLVLGGDGAGFTAVPAEFSDGFDVDLPAAAAADPQTSLDELVPTLAEFSGWEQPLTFAWDGAPGDQPFLVFGDPPADAPVQVAAGRITASGFDLQSFQDGLVVQRVEVGSTPGLAVTAVGTPGEVVPGYGRESARLVTGDGGGFVVSESGRVVTAPPVRTDPGG